MQLSVLTSADPTLPMPFDPRLALLNEEEDDESDWAKVEVAEFGGDQATQGGLVSLSDEPEAIDEGISVDEMSLNKEVAAREAADSALPPSGFVTAKTQKGIRRLHFVGNCGMIPGEHYRDLDVWGPILQNTRNRDHKS